MALNKTTSHIREMHHWRRRFEAEDHASDQDRRAQMEQVEALLARQREATP